jgi:hypothetical protein
MGAWICSDCVSGREEQPLTSSRARHCDECGRATNASALHHVSIGEIQRKAREIELGAVVAFLRAQAAIQRRYGCAIGVGHGEELERVAGLLEHDKHR